MSKQLIDSSKKTAQPLIQLTATEQVQESSTNSVTTTRSTSTNLQYNPTSQQDSNTLTAVWASNIIKQIKDELRQETASLRRKITNLLHELQSHPVNRKSVIPQYYGLQALIKNHVQTLESNERFTGQAIERFWNPHYEQKWEELEALFANLTMNTSMSPVSELSTRRMINKPLDDVQTDTMIQTQTPKRESSNPSIYFSMIALIPTFSGDLLKFESFWDMFSICVDNTPMPQNYKKAVLMTKLEGEALNIIRAKQNYDDMCEKLLKRYRDPHRIRAHYLDMIKKIPPIKNETDLVELKKLLQITETIMIGLDTQINDVITLQAIEALILDRLPPVIMNKVKITIDSPDQDIKSMIEQMHQQILLHEKMYISTSSLFNSKETSKKNENKQKNKKNQKNKQDKNKKKCDFCEGNHYNLKCDANKTVTEREDIVKKKGLCKLCLRRGHRSYSCKSKFVCPCGTKHSSLLCHKKTSSALVPVPQQTSATNPLVNEPAEPIDQFFRIAMAKVDYKTNV